jgi:hypothetical protein
VLCFILLSVSLSHGLDSRVQKETKVTLPQKLVVGALAGILGTSIVL